MLRPATPLTVVLLAAFGLLLVSVISVPIVKSLPLATYEGVNFGVFGYCKNNDCSPIEIGYNTATLFTKDQTATFNIPVTTRATLSAILVVHPIAALFTLIMLILAGTAHLHSPSHSPRYLLGVFILSILTLMLSLLAFLVDLLLFVPHMAVGSYLVLAATILIAASVVISCAMRRTLVSRKARKRRIAENAEMNGENFYNRQATTAPPIAMSTVPMVKAAPGADKLPSFATFDMSKNDPGGRTSDERVPLTARTPSERSPDGGPMNQNGSMGFDDKYGSPPRNGPGGRMNGPPARDQYGNLLPPQPAYGPGGMRGQDPRRDMSPYGRGRGGGPPGGFRGRGGPGFYPGGRGGYGPNGRGGYGPGPNRGMDNGMGPMAAGAMGGMAAGAMMRGGRGPPPGYSGFGTPPPGGRGYARDPSPGGSYGPYGRRPSDGQQSGPGYGTPPPSGPLPTPPLGGFAAYSGNDPRESIARAESPPPLSGLDTGGPVGQAVEMDASTGSPSHTPQGFTNQYGGLRDSDGDVAGMVGLQQQRANLGRHETVMSDTSRYSSDEAYVPPRQAWGDQGAGRSSPLNPSSRAPTNSSHRRNNSGDNYFEDVDPRFTESDQPLHLQTMPSASILPSSSNIQNRDPDSYLHPSSSNPNFNHGLEGKNSYEDIQTGSRSPAESERSNFTSVSQRGVNPRWNASRDGQGGYGPPVNRRPVPPVAQRNEMLLNSNPDFELPGQRSGSRTGGSQGRFSPGGGPMPASMVPRSAYESGNAL